MSMAPSDPKIHGYRTDAALTSAAKYCLVKRNGDDDFDLCAAGQLAFGALTNDTPDCSTTARSLPVQDSGNVIVKCGGAITAGTLCMSDANGKAVTGTDGNYVFGQALGTFVDGEEGLFAWGPSYLETT
jgi:hypothetical protein